jgi:hypothetical protein
MDAFEVAIKKQQDQRTFRGHLWPEHTIGDLMSAIFAIQEPSEAKDFFESYLAWQRHQPPDPRWTPEQVVRANIGWCFGEGMEQKYVEMWAQLGGSHPVFGTAKLTPDKAEVRK